MTKGPEFQDIGVSEATLVEEYERGLSVREVARRHGTTPGKVRRRLLRAGVTMRPKNTRLECGYGGGAETCSCSLCAAYRRGYWRGAADRRQAELDEWVFA